MGFQSEVHPDPAKTRSEFREKSLNEGGQSPVGAIFPEKTDKKKKERTPQKGVLGYIMEYRCLMNQGW